MHGNAPLTPEGRLRLCERIEGGWPVAHAAAAMGISRDRAYVWWRRYQEEGVTGMEDRSCRPKRCPRQTKASIERRIVTLRQNRGLGPARIAGIVPIFRRSGSVTGSQLTRISIAWYLRAKPALPCALLTFRL
jgi:transposase-like protein